MKTPTQRYFSIAASLFTFWLVLAFFAAYLKIMVPAVATLVTFLICAGIFDGLTGILVGGLAHATIFLFANSYVLFLARRGQRVPPVVVWMPSVGGIALTVLLTIWYGIVAVGYARRYQGLTYLLIFGSVHLVVLAGLIGSLVRRVRRDSRAGAADMGAVLAFNAYVHLAYLLALFPYVGEMP